MRRKNFCDIEVLPYIGPNIPGSLTTHEIVCAIQDAFLTVDDVLHSWPQIVADNALANRFTHLNSRPMQTLFYINIDIAIIRGLYTYLYILFGA